MRDVAKESDFRVHAVLWNYTSWLYRSGTCLMEAVNCERTVRGAAVLFQAT